MRLGIMQPYFLPYIGYFSLIKNTDCFILFDSVQFIRHGWIERNRVLKPGRGWQYISVPLMKHTQKTKITEIMIKNDIDWKDTIFRQLEHYKKKSPFYKETIEVLSAALNLETESIVKLNKHILETICNYIGIKFDIKIFSKMNLSIDDVKAPDEWALNICKVIENANEYWNPEGGLEFCDRTKYGKEGIDFKFLKMNIQKYSQRREEFIERLSIIDIMMFNRIDDIQKMIDDFVLL